MASSVALVFSKVIDPKNPLYLDGLCPEEPIDWEFGIMTSEKNTPATSGGMRTDINQVAGCSTTLVPEKELKTTSSVEMGKNSLKHGKEKSSEFNLVDPDEVIDPAMLNKELNSDDEDYDDDVTENSETSSNSSLQPYDLTDDDTDLKRNFSQLVDVVGALRKSDDADGVCFFSSLIILSCEVYFKFTYLQLIFIYEVINNLLGNLIQFIFSNSRKRQSLNHCNCLVKYK